jgi:hypothetical protein
MNAWLRLLILAFMGLWALAACGNMQVDPPRKDPALYGVPPWTP